MSSKFKKYSIILPRNLQEQCLILDPEISDDEIKSEVKKKFGTDELSELATVFASKGGDVFAYIITTIELRDKVSSNMKIKKVPYLERKKAS